MQSETIELLSVLLAGIIIGAINFKSSKRPFTLLFLLLIATFTTEAMAEYFAHKYRNNLVVYHLFNPIEYALFALIFYFLIENRRFKTFIFCTIIVYIPLSILNSLYIEPFSRNYINTNAILTESILLVIFSLQVLYEILTSHTYQNIFGSSAFWLSMGVILFFATNIFFWGYYNNFVNNDQGVKIFYRILFLENIVLYSLCALALWLVGGWKFNIKRKPINPA
ncbi:MAG: hypothetical protein ACJ749_14035 [Flavisolibacter sp.]